MREGAWVGVLAVVLLAPGLVSAQPAPPGIERRLGVWTDPAGMPLYTYDNDTMKGMSHCQADCANAWPAFLAPPNAKPSGAWSIIVRENGAHQWAYKDKPLYTFPADKPGRPGTGEAAGKFKLAK